VCACVHVCVSMCVFALYVHAFVGIKYIFQDIQFTHRAMK